MLGPLRRQGALCSRLQTGLKGQSSPPHVQGVYHWFCSEAGTELCFLHCVCLGTTTGSALRGYWLYTQPLLLVVFGRPSGLLGIKTRSAGC